MSDKEKQCFVISPIGDPQSDIRKRSDQVLRHIIRPAAEECGYSTVRADKIDKPGMITSQVIQHVVEDDLVVADLTNCNPNVFYELAIRHALKKPLVQIIQKGESIPFDVAGTRTIHVDHTDLDNAKDAENSIVSQIKALEEDPSDIETPISIALDLGLLRRSEKPEERSLADLVGAVTDLRTSLRKVELRLGTEDQERILGEIHAKIDRLPSRIDDHLHVAWMPRGGHSRIQPDIELIIEFLRSDSPHTPSSKILIAASIFRDQMPWLYELAVEVSRTARHGSIDELQEAVHEFKNAVDFAYHSPLSPHSIGRNKYMHEIRREIDRVLDQVLGVSHFEGRPRLF